MLNKIHCRGAFKLKLKELKKLEKNFWQNSMKEKRKGIS